MWKDKNIKIILIVGLLVRLLIMPFYFHPDIKTYHFQSSFLQAGVWDIYGYLEQNKSNLPFKEEFVYFPLTYFSLGTYQLLVSPLLGSNFHNWLFDASSGNVSNPEIFKYLLILKFPYLLIDILIAFLLTGFFSQMAQKKRVFALWLLNPFSVFIIYVFSNVDIFIVLASVAGLLLAKQKKFLLSAIVLGIGVGFKAYPLFFLPLLFLYAPNIRNKLSVVLGGLLSIWLIIGPFLMNVAFLKGALVSGLTTRILIPKIDIGFGESVIIPVFIITILFAYIALRKRLLMDDLVTGFLGIFLIIFSFIHFHIQWLLWVIPLVCLVLVNRMRLLGLTVILLSMGVVVPMLYNDKYMNVALLNAINPSYSLLPSFYTIVQKIYDPLIVLSLVHTIFAAVSLVLIVLCFNERDNEV